MGLLEGVLTFTKYRVVGEEPQGFREFVRTRLERFAFREMEGVADEKISGWVGLGSLLDSGFDTVDPYVGDYLVFSLRIDRRSIPPTLLKKRILEEELRVRSQSARKFLSREERSEIKERVRSILLSQVMAVPALYDVCWCVSERWLVFTSLAPKVREEFEKLFERTFGLKAVAYLPWDPAVVPGKLRARMDRLPEAPSPLAAVPREET